MISIARLPLRSLPRLAPSTSSSSNLLPFLPQTSRYLHVSSRCAAPEEAAAAAATKKNKVSMSAISAIRKTVPGTSMIKAKESLLATFNAISGKEDIAAALAWLEDDRQKSGASKAEKVALREAKEGMIGVCILADGLGATSTLPSPSQPTFPTPPPRAGLVELNCETDFVARNDVFNQLVQDLSHTAALFPDLALHQVQRSGTVESRDNQPHLIDLPLDEFMNFPILSNSPDATRSSARPRTVQDAIVDMVSRLGEKITLARASSISTPLPPAPTDPRRSTSIDETYIVSAFAHGGVATALPSSQAARAFSISAGKVASLLLTRLRGLSGTAASPAPASEEMTKTIRALGRSLARQAAGMQTTTVRDDSAAPATGSGSGSRVVSPEVAGQDVSTALYSQPFLMLLPAAGVSPSTSQGEEKVETVLHRWCEDKGVESVEVMDIRRWTLGETAIVAEATGSG